jgi:hypothetical protein
MRRLTLVVLILLACDRSSESELASVATWTVSVEPTIMIGVNDQLPGHQLHGVRAAFRLTDGRIAIANGGSSEIRYFTARGEFLSSTYPSDESMFRD